MEQYDPLVEILQIAEQCCESLGRITKASALRNLQTVLRVDNNLSKEIQKRMAVRLMER